MPLSDTDLPELNRLPHSDGGCIYVGHVMHMRLTPFAHRFRYRIFALLLDVDRLEETLEPLRLFGLDRFGLLAFYRRDHGARDGSDLRHWVEAQLAVQGHPPPARIRLLSFPRILGYVFNPLSVYYCEDINGCLTQVIYEVKNTFGDQHAYVVSADPDDHGTIRHQVDKGFYVSPFIAMDQTYRFTIRAPGDRLALKIRQHDGSGPWLIATQSGVRRPLTDASLAHAWALHPLMTLKVMVAIHWEALRLAVKGARFRAYDGPYPDPDATPPTLRQRFRSMLGWKPDPISD